MEKKTTLGPVQTSPSAPKFAVKTIWYKLTCIVTTCPACIALGFSARHASFDSNTVANLPASDALSDLDDFASAFVASSTFIVDDHRPNRALRVSHSISPHLALVDQKQYSHASRNVRQI